MLGVTPPESPPTALERRERRPTSSVLFLGRACSDDKHLACSVDEGVRLFLRAEARRTGQRTRVITHGAAPSENVVEAGIGLGIAGSLLLAFLAVAALFARGRRGPRAFVEEIVAARPGLDPRALAHALGPAFRVAEVSPARLVLLTGLPASSAMLRGATRPEDYPKRVELWIEEDAYCRAAARVRVTEIFAHAAGPPPQLAAQIRAALDATLRRVEHVVASV